jgi:hypothetical protein
MPAYKFISDSDYLDVSENFVKIYDADLRDADLRIALTLLQFYQSIDICTPNRINSCPEFP